MTNLQNKIAKIIYACFLIFFTLLFSLSAPERMNHTLIISLIPCAAACLIIIKKGLPKLEGKPDLLASLLTVIFLLMLSLFEIIKSPLFSSSLLMAALYLAYVACSAFIVIQFCLEYATQHEISFMDPNGAGKMSSDRRIYRLMPFYIVMAVLFLFANYPFRPSPDAMTVYNGIATHNWSDWHPIGYVTFVRLCMIAASFISYHPFAACIVQTFFWFLIFHLVETILYRCTGSARAVNLYRIMNLIIFVPLMYLGVMYKDVMYSMCVLGFCAELYLCLNFKRIERKDLILLSLFSCGIALFRHMGIVTAVFSLSVLAGYFFYKKNNHWKKPVISILFTVFSFFMVTNVYGNKILHMQKNPEYVKYTVPLYLLGNLSSEHPELFTDEDKLIMEGLMPYDDWVASYQMDTYWADNLARDTKIIGDRIYLVDDTYGKEILKLNARLLLRSPSAWMSALFRVTSIMWQIGRPADGYEWTVAGYYAPSDHPGLMEDHLVTTEKTITKYLGDLQYYLEEQPLLSFLYYRGGIWTFIMIFMAAVFLKRKRSEFLICLLPPALLTAMLMITCPSQDPRFSLPLLETGMFFLSAIVVSDKKPDK